MNLRLVSMTLALLLVFNGAVIAETTTQYTRDDTDASTVEIYLEEDTVDDDTKVFFPNAEVLDASYVVSGGADQDGNYAEDVSVTISGTYWQYSGVGYGPLGQQNEFSDGASKKSASFSNDDGGETSIELLLPVNATITNAEVTLAGLPPAGELGEYRLTSKNTDGGSNSIYPSVVVDSSDTFVVWRDDGNLDDRVAARYKILFNSRDGTGWDDPTLLYGKEDSALSEPVISGDSDYLAVAWISSYNIQGLYSDDKGNSWSDVITYDSEYSIYAHDLEVESEELYLALSIYTQNDDGEYDYRIYFSKSDDDGATWTTPVEVSDSDMATGNMAPRMDVDGSNVHISWLDGYPSTTDSSVYHASSSNGGTSFSAVNQLSGTANTGETDVTCDGSNVVVAWTEAGTATDGAYVVKARSSTNGGSVFNTESTVSSADDADAFEIDSTNDGSNNFYISWTRFDSSDNYNIAVARSSNSGSTWNPAVEIDGIGDSDLRGLAYIHADSSKIVAVWSDTYDDDGASSDPDIHYSYSTNDGSSWSSLEEIGSDQYYEADSFAPALAYSNDYLYTVYWDGGDNDPEGDTNGNDVNPSGSTLSVDGDIFFRRSLDDGENWDDAVVISNSDTDGRTYNPPSFPSYYYSYYRSDIAASGSNVYVVWSNYDSDKTQHEIRFSSSSNSGSTWSEPEVISPEESAEISIESYGPTIISNGNDVYVAWQEYRYDSTTGYYDIVYRHSNNGGSSWGSEVYVTESIEGTHYIPEIAYGNDVVHLTWHAYNTDGNAQYTIEYASSDDDGTTWERQVLRDPSSAAAWCWFPNIATEDDNVYIIWQDDDWDENGIYDMEVVLKKSGDNGGTWDEGTLLVPSKDTSTSFTYMLPAITSTGGYVYISYQDYDGSTYEHYYKFSQDSGNEWSDEYTVTNGHLLNYAKMDLTIDEDGKTYFGYSDDTNIAEEEDEDNDIFIRATIDGYPTNPTINLDGDSDDWYWPGEFNPDNSPVTWKENGENGASKSFEDAIIDGLQYAIDNDNTFVDDYGVEMANITLTVTSDTDGRVGFSDLKIEYDVDFKVDKDLLVTRLNQLVDGTEDSEDEAQTKFSVSSSTNGKIILKDLYILTVEANLEIIEMEFSDSNPKEGNDIVITVKIKNTGVGDAASVDVGFWYDNEDNEIGYRTLNNIPSGNTEELSITWRDIPGGSHEIIATIVNSVPEDISQGDEDTIREPIVIENADPDIITEFRFIVSNDEKETKIPTDGNEIYWELTLENQGEKYGDIVVCLYDEEPEENDKETEDDSCLNDIEDANLIYRSPETRIEVSSGDVIFPSQSEITADSKLNMWVANANIEQFYLVVYDLDEGEIGKIINNDGDGEDIDINVKKMPVLTVSKIEWIDIDGNIIDSFSEGTEARAKIFILNEGSFDVTATIEIGVTKSIRKLNPDPNYDMNIDFNANSETILMLKDEYPQVIFKSNDGSSVTGTWTIEISITNIQPKNDEDKDIWDPEILIFTDSKHEVEILEPPNLQMIEFTSSSDDIEEGESVIFTMVIVNEGEAEATGTIEILQGGAVIGNTTFIVQGFTGAGTVTVEYPWTAPSPYDGMLNLRAQIDPESVIPKGGPSDTTTDDFQTLELNIRGTLETGGGSSPDGISTSAMIVPLAALFVLLTGLGGAFFMYKRSQSDTDGLDAFGDLDKLSEQPPAAAPPQPEQPPAAAPPQPEQPPAAVPPPQETLLSITVPVGTQPGQQIQIKAPDGRIVAVTIPAGMQPGSQFQVKI